MCVCTGLTERETHILGVLLSLLCAQLHHCCCWLHILRAELGAKEQLRVTQTRVVTGSAAPHGKLIRPGMVQRGLWMSLEQLKTKQNSLHGLLELLDHGPRQYVKFCSLLGKCCSYNGTRLNYKINQRGYLKLAHPHKQSVVVSHSPYRSEGVSSACPAERRPNPWLGT